MKKYLFILPSLSKGGAERVVSLLASELSVKDRDVYIITHFKTFNDYQVNNRVKIICLSNLFEDEYRKKINIFYLIKLLFDLRINIKKIDPDYIIPFLWTTCIRTDISLFLSKYKKRVIQTVRNNPNIFPGNKILKKYRDYLVKKSSLTIVQNEEQKKYFSSKLHDKIKVLPNPVSNELFDIKVKKSSLFNIIGVGRLEEQKNFKLLINAFAKVNKDFKNTKLTIYGEGSLKNDLQNQIENLKMEKSIILYGRCNDYNKIYGDASLFVLSSNFEGMPNTLLEAMACGIPCISTNCPTGPSDIIQDGINGFLVETKNVEQLYESIINCIKNTKLCDKIKNNSKNHIIKKYSVSIITEKLINYCELR